MTVIDRIRWWFQPGPSVFDLLADIPEDRMLALLAAETARTDPWTAATAIFGERP